MSIGSKLLRALSKAFLLALGSTMSSQFRFRSSANNELTLGLMPIESSLPLPFLARALRVINVECPFATPISTTFKG